MKVSDKKKESWINDPEKSETVLNPPPIIPHVYVYVYMPKHTEVTIPNEYEIWFNKLIIWFETS